MKFGYCNCVKWVPLLYTTCINDIDYPLSFPFLFPTLSLPSSSLLPFSLPLPPLPSKVTETLMMIQIMRTIMRMWSLWDRTLSWDRRVTPGPTGLAGKDTLDWRGDLPRLRRFRDKEGRQRHTRWERYKCTLHVLQYERPRTKYFRTHCKRRFACIH